MLAVTTEAAIELASPPTLGTVNVCWAVARLSIVDSTIVETMLTVEDTGFSQCCVDCGMDRLFGDVVGGV